MLETNKQIMPDMNNERATDLCVLLLFTYIYSQFSISIIIISSIVVVVFAGATPVRVTTYESRGQYSQREPVKHIRQDTQRIKTIYNESHLTWRESQQAAATTA